MPRPSQNYDQEFKEQAVDLLLTSGRPLRQVANELGTTAATLRSWRNQRLIQGNQTKGTQSQASHKGALIDSAGEIRRLQREVEYLRRQRDILKKAMSILSEEPASGMR